MERWLARLPLWLAALAQVGALLPLSLVFGHLLLMGGWAGPEWALPLPGGALSPLLLLLVWSASYWISSSAQRHQMLLSPLLILAALGVSWLAVPQAARSYSPFFALVALPVIGAAWWGGGRLGAAGFYYHSAFEGLRRSLYLCFGGLLLLWFSDLGFGLASVGPLLLFGAGLTQLFLLRLEGSRIPLRTAGVVLLPLLGLGLIALLVNPSWLGVVWAGVLWVIGPIIQLIALPLSYLVVYVVRLLQWAHSRVGSPPTEEMIEGRPEPQEPPQPVEVKEGPLEVVGALLLLAGLVAVWFLIRRLMVAQKRPPAEEVDETRSGPGLLKGLLGDLRKLFAGRGTALADFDPLPPGHPRRLLRRLQAWGAKQGRERRPGETPAQYARALAPSLPAAAGLTELKAAYDETRYGSGTPAPTDLEAAERLLGGLERE